MTALMPPSASPASSTNEGASAFAELSAAVRCGFYSDRPWLLRPDDERFAVLFSGGALEKRRAHETFSFGLDHAVWRVESGLVATYVLFGGGIGRMTGLFPEGTLLGAPKAVIHHGEAMPLIARAIGPVAMRRISAEAFRQALDAEPDLRASYTSNLLANHESQMDGILVNDLAPLKTRTALLLLALFEAAGEPLGPGWNRVPYPITTQELSEMVHATRSAVSRELSALANSGLFRRTGRVLYVSARLPAAVGEALANEE